MWTSAQSRKAVGTIATYARPHRKWLLYGVLSTIGVVLFRVALPWPLRGFVEVAFPDRSNERLLVDLLPSWGDPLLWLGGIYVLLAVASGLFEMVQRVNIMRYSAMTVHDLRAAAVRSTQTSLISDRFSSGEILARIVGDTARIKSGMSGILVHVLRDGLIFLCVCGLLLYISPKLGMIFLLAGVSALLLGLRASIPIARMARRQRRKEGRYASALHDSDDRSGRNLDLERINRSSALKEVRTTKLIARNSVLAHAVLATAVALALWIGTAEVRTGQISPGDLFIFIAYALTVHRRMVQVGRQAARSGKVLACANRLGELLGSRNDADHAQPDEGQNPVRLEHDLRLENVQLRSAGGSHRKRRLSETSLKFAPGSHIAVVGSVGSGKSSLLQVIAGASPASKGRILWDGSEVTAGCLASRISYLPQQPVFGLHPVWRILGLPGPMGLTQDQLAILKNLGAEQTIRKFSPQLDSRVSSRSLSPNESRLLCLAGIVLFSTSSVWILDDPLDARGGSKARRQLDQILEKAQDRLLVLSVSKHIDMDQFSRVIELRKGRIQFDGAPARWNVNAVNASLP